MTDRRRPPLMGEIFIASLLIVVYDHVRHHAGLRRDAAFAHGQDILGAERTLNLDWETAANNFLERHSVVAEVVSWWYQLAHLSVTFSVLAWCYLAWPAGYRRARNALVLTNVAGLFVFLTWPVAPPRLLPHSGFTDTVIASLGGSAVTAPDQYGAMPSLHLAWATWVSVTVCMLVKGTGLPTWIRVPAVLYPCVTAVAVVATANHYVLDVVAGTAVAASAVQLAWAPVRSRSAARAARADSRPEPAAATP
ncbi:MAG TPA: phosphatase PAP2 family protein [Sporichthya sp.]|nr:phosphatase PAP2 family protein [Sporichthya sp.]